MSLKNKFKVGVVTLLSLGALALMSPSFAQDNNSGATNNDNAPSVVTKNALVGKNLRVIFTVVPPFVKVFDNLDNPQGLEVDIINELQKRTGFTIENGAPDLMNFSEMIDLARKGKADIVAGAISLNDERLKHFDVPKSYISNSLSLVARKNDRINSINDLSNKTLSSINGSNFNDLLKGKAHNVKLTTQPSPFMAFYVVARNKADAIIIDEIVAHEYIKIWKDTQLEIKQIIPNTESKIGLMFKKGTPESAILIQAYNEMIEDGSLDRIIHENLQEFLENSAKLSKK